MGYLLLIIVFYYLGYKSCKVLTLLREVRNVKFIEQTITKILSKDEIVIIDRAKKDKELTEEQEYKMFMEWKSSQGVQN